MLAGSACDANAPIPTAEKWTLVEASALPTEAAKSARFQAARKVTRQVGFAGNTVVVRVVRWLAVEK